MGLPLNLPGVDTFTKMHRRPSWTNAERLIGAAFAIILLIANGSRFIAGRGQLAFFDDDFYYYLQIARNLAMGRGSTFDGIHFTNGYHPLWMLVLWAICLLPQALWLPLITLMISLSAWAVFVLGRRCLRVTSMDPLLATSAGVLLGLMTILINRGGMEIVLTLPLLFLLVSLRLEGRIRQIGKSAIVYGLLGAAIILSRLDSIIFIATLFAFEVIVLIARGWLTALRSMLFLLVGLSPVLIYVLINLHFFGTATPVSGQAKQLEHHPAFSAGAFYYLFRYQPAAMRLIIFFPSITLIAAAILSIRVRRIDSISDRDRPLLLSLLSFPVIHILILAMLSDWPLWQWYLYTWIAGALGAFLVLFRPHAIWEWAGRKTAIRLSVAATTVLLMLTLMAYAAQRLRLALHPTGVTFEIYDTAISLEEFSNAHPGIYAMGDRAGIPGFLLGQPLLQVEGLVMDRKFLDHIKNQENLQSVLTAYHVRYYIGTNLPYKNGCYHAIEPAQAGSHSPKMQGDFCTQPTAVLRNRGGETEVFDLTSDER
jgi:hypothetical protein